jgi:hypothetical protein
MIFLDNIPDDNIYDMAVFQGQTSSSFWHFKNHNPNID